MLTKCLNNVRKLCLHNTSLPQCYTDTNVRLNTMNTESNSCKIVVNVQKTIHSMKDPEESDEIQKGMLIALYAVHIQWIQFK